MPLTINDFFELASLYAKKEEGHYFSYSFVSKLVKRHSHVVMKKEGKVISPRRCIEAMQKNIQDFVESMHMTMTLKIVIKSNLMFFDETVIGEDGSLPTLIAEQKDATENNANVCQTRGQRLSTFVLFSMPDSTTPYSVFILGSGNLKDCDTMKHAIVKHGREGFEEFHICLFSAARIVSCQQNSSSILWMTSQSGGEPLIKVCIAFSYVIS